MSVRSDQAARERGPAASALVPMQLRRGSQAMILLYGFPPPPVRIALQRAGLLVGTVLPAESLPGPIEQYDYLFIGPSGDRSTLFDRAVRDCVRSGWLPVELPHVSRRTPSAAQAGNRIAKQ